MSNQEFTVRIKRQPQLPLIFAFPLLIIISGIVVSVISFVGSNFVELTSFVFVPLIAWFAYGRRQRRAGRPNRALIAVMGSGLLTLTIFQSYAWHQSNLRAAEQALAAKKYADEAPMREAGYWQSCKGGINDLKHGKEAGSFDLDYCVRYFTPEETREICRPLILGRAVPRRGWQPCNAFIDEVRRAPR